MSMAVRAILRSLFVASLIACTSQALAVQPDEIMRDPAQEARARGLSRELRCMVCQNQSIDDSDAPLARDLRLLVRERIAAGDSDGQVIDFLVARYGAFVLLKPRFEAQTFALWLLPPLALAVGAALLWVVARRRRAGLGGDPAPAPLSSEEQSELQELLGNKEVISGAGARDRSITKV
jgi:cytochrome c-type biogenesis protein CcmH